MLTAHCAICRADFFQDSHSDSAEQPVTSFREEEKEKEQKARDKMLSGLEFDSSINYLMTPNGADNQSYDVEREPKREVQLENNFSEMKNLKRECESISS